MLTRAIPLQMDSVSIAEMLSALCRPPDFSLNFVRIFFFFNVVEPYRDAA